MLDKSKLGQRYICHECGTKYYDLNRPEPRCPECDADPTTAAPRQIASLLARGSRQQTSILDKAPESSESSESSEDDFENVEESEQFDELDELDEIDEIDEIDDFAPASMGSDE